MSNPELIYIHRSDGGVTAGLDLGGSRRDFLKSLMRSDDVAFWRRRAAYLLVVAMVQSLLIGILSVAVFR